MSLKSPVPPRFCIGIAGGTGAGKSTVAQNVVSAFPEGTIGLLPHDAYYRDLTDLDPDSRREYNFDHPDALDNELLLGHLEALRQGTPVDRPVYDFVNHVRAKETIHVPAGRVVVVEGILLFVDERIRRQLDVKIFVDTDSDVRVFRRIRRDMEHRGRSFASVREQYYRTVRPMHLRFVEPSKQHADLIIPEGGNQHVALDLIIQKLRQIVS